MWKDRLQLSGCYLEWLFIHLLLVLLPFFSLRVKIGKVFILKK